MSYSYVLLRGQLHLSQIRNNKTQNKWLIHPWEPDTSIGITQTKKCGLFIRAMNEIHSLIPLRRLVVTFSMHLRRSWACQMNCKCNESVSSRESIGVWLSPGCMISYSWFVICNVYIDIIYKLSKTNYLLRVNAADFVSAQIVPFVLILKSSFDTFTIGNQKLKQENVTFLQRSGE